MKSHRWLVVLIAMVVLGGCAVTTKRTECSYMVWRGNEAIARFSYGYGDESGGHQDAEDEGPNVFFYRQCSIAFTEMVLAIAKFYMGRDAKKVQPDG